MKKRSLNIVLIIILTIFLLTASIPSASASWNFGGWWKSFTAPKKVSTPSIPSTPTTSPSGSTTQTQTAQVNYEQKYNQLLNDYKQLQKEHNLLQQQQNNLFNINSKCNADFWNCKDTLAKRTEWAINVKDLPLYHDYSYTIEQKGNSFIYTYNIPSQEMDVLSPSVSNKWHWDIRCPTNSMYPMLDCKDTLIIKLKPSANELHLYDIVAVPQQSNKDCGGKSTGDDYTNCVHQITRMTSDSIVTQGTANYYEDHSTLKEDVIFKVIR